MDEILRWVAPVHAKYLDEALHAGRGAILVLPHAGSWDVVAAFAQSYGYQINVGAEASWAAELVAGSRHGGVTLIPRDRSLRPLFRALVRNQCVVMLADIAHDDIQTVDVSFFGRPGTLERAYGSAYPRHLLRSSARWQLSHRSASSIARSGRHGRRGGRSRADRSHRRRFRAYHCRLS